ncbi:MAG: zinc-ribbon domain-containing protein [Defluviitaleaceae bacterium]|nr:zinc-ribbon domain-containing protein [Defluviitaleaceae bacterium]
MLCPQCGKQNEENAGFCVACGKNISGETIVKETGKGLVIGGWLFFSTSAVLICISLMLFVAAISLASQPQVQWLGPTQAQAQQIEDWNSAAITTLVFSIVLSVVSVPMLSVGHKTSKTMLWVVFGMTAFLFSIFPIWLIPLRYILKLKENTRPPSSSSNN